MKELTEALSMFAQNLLLAGLPALVVAAVGWVLLRWQDLKSKLPAETLSLLTYLCDEAVLAAEKAKLAGLIRDKKAEAVKFVQGYLDRYGIKIDVALIEMAVEAAVQRRFPKGPTDGGIVPEYLHR